MPITLDEKVDHNIYKYTTRAGDRFMVRIGHGYSEVKRKGFASAKDAGEWLTTFRADLINQKYFPGRVDAPPLHELATDWLKDAARKNLRHNTLRSYKANLNRHILPALGKFPLNRITRTHIADFIARKKSERPKKPYSRDAIRLMLAPLSCLFSDVLDANRYGIEVNPCLRPGRLIMIKTRTKTLKAYSPKEEAAILKACRRIRPDQHALLCTLFWAGLRPGEAWALERQDLQLAKRLIAVSKSFTDGELHDTPKTGQTRIVEISDKLVAVLRRHRPQGPLLFPGRKAKHRHQSMWNRKIWTVIVEQARAPHYSPYATRHTYATRQLERGCSLQWLMHQMGHSSIKITVDTYGHLARRKT